MREYACIERKSKGYEELSGRLNVKLQKNNIVTLSVMKLNAISKRLRLRVEGLRQTHPFVQNNSFRMEQSTCFASL